MLGRLARLALLGLMACDPGHEPGPATALRRDADLVGLILPAFEGTANSRMGTLVLRCDDDFLATGVDRVVWGERNMGAFPPLAPQAELLSCTGPVPHLVLAGGSGGLWRYVSPSWELVSDAGVQLYVRHPTEQTVIVSNSTTRVLSSIFSFPVGAAASGAAWSESGDDFAVVGATQAQLYGWTGSGVTLTSTINARPGTAFTSAIAVGDLGPTPGLEIAVGLVDGGVEIFSESSSSLLRFDFGSSVAIESDYSGGIDGLLVGDPERDRVLLMVGDASVRSWEFPDAGLFGHAVASRTGFTTRDVAVGSPGFAAGAGAVFTYRRFRLDPPGTASLCDVSAPCSTPTGTAGVCTAGTCVGGVVCIDQLFGCPAGWECLLDRCTPIDAGEPDAGEPDAGEPDAGESDAGEPDAGEPDGGEPDAGEPDAGPDGGAPDAGSSTDAGSSDAGASATDADGGELPREFIAVTCSTIDASHLSALCVAAWLARRRACRKSDT